MTPAFTRREITTRGADPTVVVTWAATHPKVGLIDLTEFQGIIVVETEAAHQPEMGTAALRDLTQALGEALHIALERAYTAEQEVESFAEEGRLQDERYEL